MRIAVNMHTFANSSIIIPICGTIDRGRHRKKFIASDKEEKMYVAQAIANRYVVECREE